MRKSLFITHKALALFISIGAILQMLLAGLWHARVFSTPEAHVFFGISLLLAALIALVAALVGRMGRAVIIPTAILFLLILLQPILMSFRYTSLSFLSAFHPMNAAFIGAVAATVSARSKMPAAEPQATAQPAITATGD